MEMRSVSDQPWMNRNLDVDRRASLVLAQMTRAEKLLLVNGHTGSAGAGAADSPDGALGPAGFVAGVERLLIPALQETDASLGVANLREGGATALPSGLALAASWDEALVEQGGAMIGAEARAMGFNVMLAGGANLTREPRCGRNFEYLGEDPLLAGVLAGASIRGVQSNRIVATIKHFALNAQETGRMVLSAEMDEAALRESDLLAFEIGIERGNPGSVMTAYNRINGVYAGEHEFLLNKVLKQDWGYRGWTMSDWGGCHSTEKAALAGLDQESGQELDREPYFTRLDAAIEEGRVPEARLNDMVTRILRSMFEHGVVDDPPKPGGAIDREAHLDVAQRAAAAGIVLLKNAGGALPLSRNVKSIAVVGAHADLGVLSGGGSSSVAPWGGFAREVRPSHDGPWAKYLRMRWHPSAPLAALRAAASNVELHFHDGADRTEAAKLAASCEVAIVFAEQWTSEFIDVENLSLPHDQDGLISVVAAANPKTIVVLETGGPVLMPWLADVSAVLEAWYPGARGAEAIAAVLFGDVNPSGRLPITFPQSEADLPNPLLPGKAVERGRFDVSYPEGADAGYRWYGKTKRAPLFPFGFGLSYTTFAYANLVVKGGEELSAGVDVTNTGDSAGAHVVQFYLTHAAGEETVRLVGWQKVWLRPGETANVAMEADQRFYSRYDVGASTWDTGAGRYTVAVGDSAVDLRLQASILLTARSRGVAGEPNKGSPA